MAELKYKYDKVATKLQRNREIRDIYRKLMKEYRRAIVYEFLAGQYFIGDNLINSIIVNVDSEPVNRSKTSFIYKVTMRANFKV